MIISTHPARRPSEETAPVMVDFTDRSVRIDRMYSNVNMTTLSYNGDILVVNKPSTIVIGRHYTAGATLKFAEVFTKPVNGSDEDTIVLSDLTTDYDLSFGPSDLPVVFRYGTPMKRHAVFIRDQNAWTGGNTIQGTRTGEATILVIPDAGVTDDLRIFYGSANYMNGYYGPPQYTAFNVAAVIPAPELPLVQTYSQVWAATD